MDKIKIIILAAGAGKRMGEPELPKVLIELNGRPLINYLLAAVKKSGIDSRPVIVVGQKAELVKETLGPEYDYVLQAEQLGTGHAVMRAKSLLENKAENILVLYGDQPLLNFETINNLAGVHLASGKVLTMGTVLVPDFSDWRAGFFDFGRVGRDESGKVIGIIEKKDAAPEQLAIKEVNPSYFCFQAGWLWQNLEKIKNDNQQKEYYLTDLIKIARQQGEEIATVPIEPKEAAGVNTEEQLKLIEKLMK
ncbi:MAG: hypothetical protein A3J65_01480 [Candidatus Buchananbacteria bacterium RIFCSPHIGHO2_02_FULL_45_11b]|uniref:MobA-like NTP transferase domain-containing protein n=4 Tax=Candidatus Buchananiibacteriota TaxID=1817903 RepID=A0A1G1Y7Q6_9BACT|nr:MAG: hypothetical protein A2663_03630 [Candidatus Buchananbacteria bacterium RIFCSPHIGHO2_01_FULL_46_12]OGY52430.1 MAG: hypothetical protein A3J65_01480 [Candidatus Buchananbacteria bacterium RIFCSPHIGHO2_02_FULL_45_11b]OGY53838.1 MAG: hypothetical protein A3B15_02070 [Candidatus Buchananbacteria bacterium RIFCSPLOWO2_01_FULL_45_31]OGY56144.1 MAG: hypothetical protein A3H67_00310 [Candidatus Buchananbacteria bacterium RIFCSPLOWO2_02_FULL_46_11b]